MLLEHFLLSDEQAAAELWRLRERTEHEAATLFARLADDLARARVPDALVALARRCSEDECVHAEHCRRIVDALVPGLAPLVPDLEVGLGEVGLGREEDPRRRALYASVALGCVTESLSTALLIAIRPHARLGVVREGLDRILADEVRHSRLGWAHLAVEARRGEVGWLGRSLPRMLRAALASDELALGGPRDLRAYGILGRDDVSRICQATIEQTIVPGLARFGVGTGEVPGR